ncbi:Protein of unknown function (DUF3313) [Caulobacter sp. AP07]|uniref:DUF3313 family protein n=1 Tax=Caulobacter sp. AP07 TaxID=1144304 RepID=UPI0002721B97|nr:DUF3313 family protein [Caulobacter sp. AP07]EJL24983.1 Protein of unknown function (DUF3313) [Caulobacter sp. AP07]
MRTMVRAATIAVVAASLGACAAAGPERPGFLSTYAALPPSKPKGRAHIREYVDKARIAQIRRVSLEPTIMTPGADAGAALTEEERRAVLREIDAQVCFRLSRWFEIVPATDPADARARAAVTWITPTGRASSAASATAGLIMPLPVTFRVPGGLGGLGVEAELIETATNQQVAAIAWTRQAMPIGGDTPSLARHGDALQFAEPFAEAVTTTLTPTKGEKGEKVEKRQKREIKNGQDPCAAYGARFRASSMAAGMLTNMYVPTRREAAVSSAEPKAPPVEKGVKN